MREWIAGMCALALPLTAQAASQWCPAKPDSSALAPIQTRLAPLLDSPA